MSISTKGRSQREIISVLSLLCVLLPIGCGETRAEPNLVKVSGIVHVDGKPAEGVVLTLHRTDQADALSAGAISTGVSKQDGAFQISTYELGDGAAPGNYNVTFVWSEFDLGSRSQKGDRLNGRYSRPESSLIRWTLIEKQVLNVGVVSLGQLSEL